MSATRGKVLRLYRTILKNVKKWPAKDEIADLKSETQGLFRANASLTSQEAIERKLLEGESRLELALHYKIAAPRLYYVPPRIGVKTKRKRLHNVKPAYMDSYFKEDVPAHFDIEGAAKRNEARKNGEDKGFPGFAAKTISQ